MIVNVIFCVQVLECKQIKVLLVCMTQKCGAMFGRETCVIKETKKSLCAFLKNSAVDGL